jgi:hypothetical protein
VFGPFSTGRRSDRTAARQGGETRLLAVPRAHPHGTQELHCSVWELTPSGDRGGRGARRGTPTRATPPPLDLARPSEALQDLPAPPAASVMRLVPRTTTQWIFLPCFLTVTPVVTATLTVQLAPVIVSAPGTRGPGWKMVYWPPRPSRPPSGRLTLTSLLPMTPASRRPSRCSRHPGSIDQDSLPVPLRERGTLRAAGATFVAEVTGVMLRSSPDAGCARLRPVPLKEYPASPDTLRPLAVSPCRRIAVSPYRRIAELVEVHAAPGRERASGEGEAPVGRGGRRVRGHVDRGALGVAAVSALSGADVTQRRGRRSIGAGHAAPRCRARRRRTRTPAARGRTGAACPG